MTTHHVCPCGRPAIKRDGAGYVCEECLAIELYFTMHDHLSDEERKQRASRRAVDQWAAIVSSRREPEARPGPLGLLIRGYGSYAL